MKIFLTGLMLLCSLLQSYSQSPLAIPYQAVARNAAGDLIVNQNISLRFSIRNLVANGTIVFREIHAATTNNLGLFTANVGQGTPDTGTFEAIAWSTGAKFLEVELDAAGGTNYSVMGTQQLLSVPYALYAGSSNVPNGSYTGQTLMWNGSAWVTDTMLTNTGNAIGIGLSNPTSSLHTKGTVRHESLSGIGAFRPVYADSTGKLSSIAFFNANGSASPASAIPDNGCASNNGVTSTISLADFAIPVSNTLITVTVNITHPLISQIAIFLVAPTGQVLRLKSFGSGSGANLINTIFTDTASIYITGVAGPATGYYRPAGVIGTSCTTTSTIAKLQDIGQGKVHPDGIWTLKVFDSGTGNTGVLNSWSLNISYSSGGKEGVNNFLPKWEDGVFTDSSNIYDNGINVGIGTGSNVSSAALLELKSTDKGFILPRMNTTQRNAMLSPVEGLQIFNTDDQCTDIYDGANWIKNCGLKVKSMQAFQDFQQAKADFPGTPRAYAAAFAINNKVYVGTGLDGAYKNDFWQYDPANDIWTQKASITGNKAYTVAFTIGSRGYVGTGYDVFWGVKDFKEYNPTTNTWLTKTNFGGTGRRGATGFSIGTKGYIGTGEDGTNYRKDFWEYDQATNVWTQKADFGGGERWWAVGLSIGSKGYIGTGGPGSYGADFWEYDSVTNSWAQKANLGGGGRAYAIAFTLGSKGYIGTGENNSGRLSDVWEYDPATDNWTQKADAGGGPRSGAVAVVVGTKAYIGTGLDNNNIYKKDFYEYDPSPVLPVYAASVISSGAAAVDDGAWTFSGNTIYKSDTSGHVGIGTSSPAEKLHVANGNIYSNGENSGVIVDAASNRRVGLMKYTGIEGALVHGNTVALRFGQVNQADVTGGTFTEQMRIDNSGNIGIGTPSPAERLDISGKLLLDNGFSADNAALVYNNNTDYLFFGPRSGTSTNGAIISLYGNTNNISSNPNGIDFNTGSAILTMRMLNNGNVGINTLNPGSKLDVAGNFKLGSSGTVLNNLIKTTVNVNVASVAANASLIQTFTVTNAVTGGTVYVSPSSALPDGLIISYARVSAAGTVEVKFRNTSGAAIDPAAMDYYITVIQ